MGVLNLIGASLQTSFSMFWDVFWPLSLGFMLSAAVQAVAPTERIRALLGGVSARSAALAAFFGMVSSSCSYAAVALARSLFVKGASLVNTIVFELASTHLVIELGIVLWILLGWQFLAAEVFGGILMIIIAYALLRLTRSRTLERDALVSAKRGVAGRMEGHAHMDMSIGGSGSWLGKLLSAKGRTALSHYYVMDWTSVWTDLLIGFLVAGALAVFVPKPFWSALFFSNDPALSRVIDPLIGPLVAAMSFVCSVGNIPLAAVLWQRGISFGGVLSFIYGDLIILPILDIYRRYYGGKASAYLFFVLYLSMAAAGYITELVFSALGLVPQTREVGALAHIGISLNYATYLNVLFALLGVVLVIRFLKTGGRAMLKMMEQPVHDA